MFQILTNDYNNYKEDSMSDKLTQRANVYFEKRCSIVYVERCYKIESFSQFLQHRYRNSSYYYTFFALMGLQSNDSLVRGYINFRDWKNYNHGWVEFTYEENEYVFDPFLKTVMLKQEWYEEFNPSIQFKKTQKEILDTYLNEKYAFKIDNKFWQFKETVIDCDDGKLSYHKFLEINMKNGYIPSTLSYARVVMGKISPEVFRFIGYFRENN